MNTKRLLFFIGLITLILSTAAINARAGQVIRCFDQVRKSDLRITVRFPTDDLSKYAKFTASGPNLFHDKKVSQDKCQAFTMRGRKYYNTYVIHNFGCSVWSCSLYIPDTLHGVAEKSFDGLVECFPADSDQNIWVKYTLGCSSVIE